LFLLAEAVEDALHAGLQPCPRPASVPAGTIPCWNFAVMAAVSTRIRGFHQRARQRERDLDAAVGREQILRRRHFGD
jgi:hypothetical protein